MAVSMQSPIPNYGNFGQTIASSADSAANRISTAIQNERDRQHKSDMLDKTIQHQTDMHKIDTAVKTSITIGTAEPFQDVLGNYIGTEWGKRIDSTIKNNQESGVSNIDTYNQLSSVYNPDLRSIQNKAFDYTDKGQEGIDVLSHVQNRIDDENIGHSIKQEEYKQELTDTRDPWLPYISDAMSSYSPIPWHWEILGGHEDAPNYWNPKWASDKIPEGMSYTDYRQYLEQGGDLLKDIPDGYFDGDRWISREEAIATELGYDYNAIPPSVVSQYKLGGKQSNLSDADLSNKEEVASIIDELNRMYPNQFGGSTDPATLYQLLFMGGK